MKSFHLTWLLGLLVLVNQSVALADFIKPDAIDFKSILTAPPAE